MSKWIKPSITKPEEGKLVLITNGRGYEVAVWLPEMGKNGDFATITNKGKRTIFSHCPGVTAWAALPPLPQSAGAKP
jgi:hypothetical protein